MLDLFYLAAGILLLPLWIGRILAGRLSLSAVWRRAIGIAPLPGDVRPTIWFHAASVGETLALSPLIRHFAGQKAGCRIVVSTETPEGLHAAEIAFGREIIRFHVPFDLRWCVRRAYAAIRPQLFVLSELELWPNLLGEAHVRGVPIAVVNSRMNDADFRFFQRINRWHRRALTKIAWWGAQTPRDAERIEQLLGAAATTVEVTGSIKYDTMPDKQSIDAAAKLHRWLGFVPGEKIFLAGSSHASEEEILLDAFRALRGKHPSLRLVLAPRHPRRFRRVARLLGQSGIPFAQRSRLNAPLACSQPVTLIDSIGELCSFWSHADFAFVGGSISPHAGGQNVIEPAVVGKPVCFGPHVWNFAEAAAGLLRADAAREVRSAAGIVEILDEWLEHPQRAKQMGANGAACIRSLQGGAAATIRALERLLLPSVDCHANAAR